MKRGAIIAGRFEIERRAGTGGMGTVYRALDRESGVPVALKVLHDTSGEAGQRFVLEARALSELSHPHVVRYVTSGVDEERGRFLVMEWLEGEDLGRRLQRARLSTEESLVLARLVAEGLGAAHAAGIVHRDIKPTNLLLVDGQIERVKIVDFGIARLAAFADNLPPSRSLTKPGFVLGTPGYMAPEQAAGEGAPIEAPADVFSLGTVLYECLTGEPAFEAAAAFALLAKVLCGDPPRLSEARPDLPPALDVLLRRMLAKDPRSRPANGLSLANEIRALSSLGLETTAEVPVLLDEPSGPTLTDEEARLASVLGILPKSSQAARDWTGLTETSPKEVLARVRAEVTPLGARVFELANGALVVTLLGVGEPIDRAARAARSALRLRALLPDAPLALATGRAEGQQRAPVGEVMDRVARLLEQEQQEGAHAVGVRIDEVTQALLDARFEVQTQGDAARLLGERPSGEVARTLLGRPSPFVGRERELRMARDLIEAAFEEERSQAVMLVGPAGIGKSRLREELLTRICQDKPDITLLRGRGDLLGQGSAFSLLGTALRSLFDAGASDRESRWRAFIDQYVAGEDAARVAAFVGEMVGQSLDDSSFPLLRACRQDPSLMKERIREAFVDLLRAMAKKRPVLLVLEDVQWGDAASMRLLDIALRELASVPFVALLLARPEALSQFPPLSRERAQEIRMLELGRRAGEKLARHFLGEHVSDDLLRDLITHAAGNPFCLEELLRAIAEGRAERLPETVLGMVEARLDALDPPLRRLLRAASIYGETFPAEGLPCLLGEEEAPAEGELSASLHSLVDREILVAQKQSRHEGTHSFAFRHSLLREGAYATLTERDRALGHRLAGEFLESNGERDPKILATHFELGQANEKAIPYLLRAAEFALSTGDDEEAIEHAAKGLRLGAQGDIAATLWAIQTDAYAWNGDLSRADECAQATLTLATKGSRTYYRALGSAISNARAQGKVEERLRLAEELFLAEPASDAIAAFAWAACTAVMPHLIAAERGPAERHIDRLTRVAGASLAEEPAARAWTQMTRAFYVRYVARDYEVACKLDREALSLFESIGENRYAPYVRMHVGLDCSLLGAFDEAILALQKAIQTAEPESATAKAAQVALYRAYLYQGSREDLRELAAALLNETEARNESIPSLSAALLLAEIALHERDAATARGLLSRYEPLANAYPFTRMTKDTLLSACALLEENPAEALSLADRALAEAEALGMFPFSHEMALCSRVRALIALGRTEEADKTLIEARKELVLRASRMENPQYRKSFLESVAANAELVSRAAGPSTPTTR